MESKLNSDIDKMPCTYLVDMEGYFYDEIPCEKEGLKIVLLNGVYKEITYKKIRVATITKGRMNGLSINFLAY